MPELLCMTSAQVRAYLDRAGGVIVPTGSVEQHGNAGLVGTDAICAEAVARRAAAAADALLAPTVTLGMAQFNLGFPGTLTLRPTTLVAVMVDYLQSLAVQGFTHVYVLNGHGGNVAPIRTAFQEFYADRSLAGRTDGPFYCRLVNWWDPPGVNALRRELYGDHEGFHATPSEVAITAALHDVRPGDFPAEPPGGQDSAVIQHGGDPYFHAADHVRRYPDGRVQSHPRLATAADGARLLAMAAQEIAADYQTFCAAS